MRKLKKKIKIFMIFLIFVIIIGAVCSFLFIFNKKNDVLDNDNKEPVVEKKLNIIDLNSNSRPIAVMINNIGVARKYHSGLQDAYMVYEMIVEGGITRLMAVYKDADTAKIGSIRSSRHYYLDYALENDALYVHWGYSEYAENDIKSLGINNLNGLIYGEKYFWRDKSLNVSSEHTAFTSMELINSGVEALDYRRTTSDKPLLKYSVDEIDISTMEGAIPAETISIKYSNSATTSYDYDSENKVYKRSVNGEAHIDYLTKEQYTAKNIITYQVKNTTIAGDTKGRQNLSNIGSGQGYYITNGMAIPITWSKTSRSAKTVYKFLNGQELVVNDGNTYIQIQPSNEKLIIS